MKSICIHPYSCRKQSGDRRRSAFGDPTSEAGYYGRIIPDDNVSDSSRTVRFNDELAFGYDTPDKRSETVYKTFQPTTKESSGHYVHTDCLGNNGAGNAARAVTRRPRRYDFHDDEESEIDISVSTTHTRRPRRPRIKERHARNLSNGTEYSPSEAGRSSWNKSNPVFALAERPAASGESGGVPLLHSQYAARGPHRVESENRVYGAGHPAAWTEFL